MAISRAEVRRIAELAQLELDEGGVEAFREQLQTILDHVARLDELGDLDGSADAAGSAPAGPTPLRNDEPRPGLGVDEALGNAPDAAEGHFRVPRVLRE